MARPTLRSVRDNIDSIRIGETGLANDQHYKRRILEREFKATGNLAIASVLDQERKHRQRQEAARRHNTKPRRVRNRDGRPRRKDFKSPEGFNGCSAVAGRSYASKAGERMAKKLEGFPDTLLHPATIGLLIIPCGERVDEHVNKSRPMLRCGFGGLSYGSLVTGGFHIAIETAAYLSTIFPPEEWPPQMDPITRPDQLFAYLHFHGVIADPYLSKSSIRKMIKEHFPGKRRVCVAQVQPERTNKDGEITHGAQGFLEYAMMEKTEIKVAGMERKKEAVIGLAELSATWSKRNRSFTMGKSLAATGVVIDQDRVLQLQLEERLAFVKKNWEKLDYAHQFIHLWMSGRVSIFKKSQPWLKHGDTVRERFVSFIGLVKKWCAATKAEDVDFFDYLDTALE